MTSELRSRDLQSLVAATREFNPERLTLARELAGLDLKELALRVDMTSSAISQFEKGRTRPRTDTLIRMALALGVPPEFFGAPVIATIPSEACHFRSLRSITAKERRRVLAHGSLAQSVFDYLKARINFPEEEISSLAETISTGCMEDVATAVRDAWNLGYGPIGDMVGLMESKGVLAVEIPDAGKRMDAFSAWVESQPILFLIQCKNSGTRRRFDAAHELGHLLLHRRLKPGSSRAEKEADAFASAFLLPRTPFSAECPDRLNWGRLRLLKRRWGVSLAAIIRRAYDLGIISEATYRRAYVHLSRSGWRTVEPDEPQLERPSLLQRAFGLMQSAGYSLATIADDLRLGEPLLEMLVFPIRSEQVALEM